MTPCDAVDNEVKVNEVVVDASAVYTLPAGADFIMCYSVAEGERPMMEPGTCDLILRITLNLIQIIL